MSNALIVDDNYYNRDLVALALKHMHFDIAEAENGKEALTILKDNTFDLLVLDLEMPEVHGLQVLQQVRTFPKHDKMVVIVMTANPHMSSNELDSLATLTMYKPIDIAEFSRFVSRFSKSPEYPSTNVPSKTSSAHRGG